jgi:thioester reductase-like protein
LSGSIATAEGVVQALKTTPAEIAFLVPSIVAELSQSPALLEYCSQHLELILYAGGDLPQAIGDKIAAKLPIRCNYGSSEVGLASQLLPPEMTALDWRYVCPHPDLGLEFEEITPGMFEMVVVRDPKYEESQLPFSIGPSMQDLQTYRTRDLFVKHPTIPNCWGWRARADDIIVFLNGEKTNPVSMEQHVIAKNEQVSAALVVGMQRFQAALLVEPVAKSGGLNVEESNALIETIWPSVAEANKVTPAHARVEKSMILLTSVDKPMIRSGKGTIQRQGTVAQYANEIDDLYTRADTAISGAEKASVDTKDAEQVSKFIKQAVSKIEPDLLQEGEDNFLSLGMDSLMAMRLIRALRHGLGKPELEVSVVYNNPGVQMLTRYIVGSNDMNSEKGKTSKQSEIEMLLDTYEQSIKSSPDQSYRTGTEAGEVVILTGSTGSLGVHLLEALLKDPTISHIYCLDRRENAQEIHEAKFKSINFPLGEHSERVSFLHAVLHERNLGLDEKTYETLRSTTTLIIHNAWSVNFMQPLKTFCPQFDGLINLFRLASSRKDPPKTLYISSISSVAGLPRSSASSTIPEEVIRDFDAPYVIGYAQSKLVSELLCDTAARRLGIPVSFARVGQITGRVNGETVALWNTAEWLPSLVLTSISLGVLPDSLGTELNKVDWIPVDILAKVLVELGSDLTKGLAGAEVFNLMNPRLTAWEKLVPGVVSSVEKYFNKRISVVPLESWLDKLQETADGFSSTDTTDLARTHPAIKLQEFYEARMLNSEHVVNWDLGHAMEKSKTLKEMPAVGEEWMEKWVEGWVAEIKSWEN